MTKAKPVVPIPKMPAAHSPERKIVKRGLPPLLGSGNLVVIKKGEDLLTGLQDRLGVMKKDFETVEFFWSKVMKDPTYNETKEWPDHLAMVTKWELQEGVKNLAEYKAKMRRMETLIDHFQPGHDYELTVNEVVEISS